MFAILYMIYRYRERCKDTDFIAHIKTFSKKIATDFVNSKESSTFAVRFRKTFFSENNTIKLTL